MKFYERFLEDILESGWSRNYISTEFHINRGLLYKYLNGTQLIPYDTFVAILNSIKISQIEKLLLRDLYFAEAFGEETLKRVKEIEHLLLKMNKSFITDKTKAELPLSIDIAAFERNDKLYLKTQTDILSAVRYIFQTADKGKIYTNYSYDCENFDNTVFNCCLIYSGFQLEHYLVFTATSYIRNLFCSARYLRNGINPICLYSYDNSRKLSPFPFFFSVGNFNLFFSSDCRNGILMKDADIFHHIENMLNMQPDTSTRLAIFPQTLIETANTIASNIDKISPLSFSEYPCLAPIANADFIYSIVKKDIPDYLQMAEIAVNHYATAFGDTEQGNYIIHESGLRDFAKSGVAREGPENFLNPASKEYRIIYFQKMKELNKIGRLKVVCQSRFDIPKGIAINLLNNQRLFLCGVSENIPDEQKMASNWIVSLNDTRLNEDLRAFFDYLTASSVFYTQKGADHLLNSLIILLKS